MGVGFIHQLTADRCGGLVSHVDSLQCTRDFALADMAILHTALLENFLALVQIGLRFHQCIRQGRGGVDGHTPHLGRFQQPHLFRRIVADVLLVTGCAEQLKQDTRRRKQDHRKALPRRHVETLRAV